MVRIGGLGCIILVFESVAESPYMTALLAGALSGSVAAVFVISRPRLLTRARPWLPFGFGLRFAVGLFRTRGGLRSRIATQTTERFLFFLLFLF